MPDPVLSHVWTDTGTGSGTSWTFDNGGADWTPVAGDGYVLIVFSAGATGNPTADPTAVNGSANGLDFELAGSSQFSSSPILNVGVWTSQPAATPAAGKITASWAVSQGGVMAMLLKVDNPGSWGALVNGLLERITFVDSDPNTVADITVTQAVAAIAGSVIGVAVATNINGQVDPSDASFTELADVTIAGGRNRTLQSMWRAGVDDLTATGVSKNTGGTATNAKMLAVMFEVVNATSLTAVGKSLALQWSQRANVGKNLQTVWNVAELGVTPSPVVTFGFSDSSTGTVASATIDNAGVNVTPPAGKGAILLLQSAAATGLVTALATDVDGSSMGLDFQLAGFIEHSASPVIEFAVYASQPAVTPAAGHIAVTWDDNQAGWQAIVLWVEDPADYGPWGHGMIEYIGFADSDPNTVASLLVEKPYEALTGSVMVAGFSSNINGSLTPSDASYTELADITIATGRNRSLEVMWRAGSDDVSASATSYNASAVATSAKIAGVIIELLRATAPTTRVGRSVQLVWDVEVLDPPTTHVVQIYLRGAVTEDELGSEPTAPPDAPIMRMKVNGVWTLIAGSRAPGA